MTDATDELLAERGKTHGDWKVNAAAQNEIRNAIQKWDVNGLEPWKIEALHMIATKIGRIITGNSNHRDHWDDIAGYARLAAERCGEST